ncbi:Protein CBG21583 [Caenorhabditis briggsae]|nr:Protein CBG21583 [Caenorhabditis briggsae]ULT93464.1 hypothetical protein L3Y34_003153 [Caenorhabditis briggsae]CAP38340.1 Protein CBG21583 [Caenorhabditis briggsae]
MAEPPHFLADTETRRKCIMYEYLRGKSVDETLQEMGKTNRMTGPQFDVDGQEERDEVEFFFVKFKSGDFRLHLNKSRKDLLPNLLNHEEINRKDKVKFFATQLQKSSNNPVIQEMEIFASTEFPESVMIGIEIPKVSRECVHYHKCDTGIVARYIRATELMVSTAYTYQDIALIDTNVFLKDFQKGTGSINSLKIHADEPLENEFYNKLIEKFRQKEWKLDDKNLVTNLVVINKSLHLSRCVEMARIFPSKTVEIKKEKLDERDAENFAQFMRTPDLKINTLTVSISETAGPTLTGTMELYEDLIGRAINGFTVDYKYGEGKIVFTRTEEGSSSTGRPPAPKDDRSRSKRRPSLSRIPPVSRSSSQQRQSTSGQSTTGQSTTGASPSRASTSGPPRQSRSPLTRAGSFRRPSRSPSTSVQGASKPALPKPKH